MTPAEAKAWLDGFAAGVIYMATDGPPSHMKPDAYIKIRAELREAHRRAREAENE